PGRPGGRSRGGSRAGSGGKSWAGSAGRPGEVKGGPVQRRPPEVEWPFLIWTTAVATVLFAVSAHAFRPPELTKAQQDDLRRNFAPCLSKIKGPYTENYCICPDGQKLPVQVKGRVTSPCSGSAIFCSAYRAPWAEALGRQRMWIANLFARDLYLWDTFTDHHDLVR